MAPTSQHVREITIAGGLAPESGILCRGMLELIFELLMQIFGELLFDVVLHWVNDLGRFTRTIVLVIWFAIIGALLGGISLMIFPSHYIRDADLRLAALLVTPVITGALFAVVGRGRLRKGKPVSALEEFWPAFSFAMGIALVRYLGAA